MPQEPEAVDLFTDVRQGAVRDVYQLFRVATVATVASFARAASRVIANSVARVMLYNRTVADEPSVPDVPVINISGGGYGMWFDLRKGDPVTLLCCDAPVRPYFETGNPVTPSTQTASQSHEFGCAVAFPGGRIASADDLPEPSPPNAEGECLVGGGDGTAAVIFRQASGAELGTVVVAAAGPVASVLLGGTDATIPVACATQTAANFMAINTTIQGLPVVPGDPGVILALKAAFNAYALALQDIADAKVRVQGPAAP